MNSDFAIQNESFNAFDSAPTDKKINNLHHIPEENAHEHVHEDSKSTKFVHKELGIIDLFANIKYMFYYLKYIYVDKKSPEQANINATEHLS